MDYGHAETDKMLSRVEKRIEAEYRQAVKEIHETARKKLAHLEAASKEMDALYKAGKITRNELYEWKKKRFILTQKYQDMERDIINILDHKDQAAAEIIENHRYEVYALNYNYGMYEVEKGAKIKTTFALYDRDTVARLVRNNPRMLPKAGKKTSEKIRRGELKKWNRRQLQSVMTQGILQGESIPKIARRIAVTMGERNSYSHIRAARTMTTGAENAGRQDSYIRAEEMGIKMGKTWLAVHDNHTRRSHVELDGETVPVNETFSNDLMYPAEPTGEPAEVYNCRCTMVADVMSVDGVDLSDINATPWEDNFDIDYEEWKKGKED